MSRATLLKTKSLSISFIIPIYNEAQNITRFIEELYQVGCEYSNKLEIMVIDDGSQDESAAIVVSLIDNYPLKLISLSRNFGKEAALTAGLEYCTGEVAIIIDADFQHPFTTIPQFLQKWSEGYKMVYGIRTNRKDETWLKKHFTALFYQVTSLFSEVVIPKDAGDFRLLDRKVINALKKLPERNRFMKGLYAWVGFKTAAVPFEVQRRTIGKSSWSFRRLLGLALNGMFAFSNLPLRIWSVIGLFISAISFIYALWIVFKSLAFGVELPGFATIVVAVMLFGGIQLLSIGILGEYIGRIFTELKQRPNYIIAAKQGFVTRDKQKLNDN